MERNYPRAHNKKLWTIIEERLAARKILVSKEVKIELGKQSDSTGTWLGQFPRCIIDSTDAIQKIVSEIVKRYPTIIDLSSTHHDADVFVIAVAKKYNASVVTQERFRKESRSIPALCQKEQIKCLDLVKFLVEEGFK